MRTTLICLFVAICGSAMAQEGHQGIMLPDGTRGSGHPEYHDAYQNLHNNKMGVSCCHDRDCRPTQAKQVMEGDEGHWEVMINGNWVRVEPRTIIPKSIDGIAHICAGEPSTMYPAGRI